MSAVCQKYLKAKKIISVCEQFVRMKKYMTSFFLSCQEDDTTLQGYRTPSSMCGIMNVLPQSGSGVSSAGSQGVIFCLYMKVNRKSAMSCEHQ